HHAARRVSHLVKHARSRASPHVAVTRFATAAAYRPTPQRYAYIPSPVANAVPAMPLSEMHSSCRWPPSPLAKSVSAHHASPRCWTAPPRPPPEPLGGSRQLVALGWLGTSGRCERSFATSLGRKASAGASATATAGRLVHSALGRGGSSGSPMRGP